VISCSALARIVSASRGTVVASRAEKAEAHWARLMGLMGRRTLPEDGALLIVPCSSVQTCFMRFAIDVVFLDRDSQVVKVVSGLKPYRAALGGRGARSVLELPAGAAARCGIAVGDRLVWEDGG
jgi:uncharacterized membrane protein (UPF0127 family)